MREIVLYGWLRKHCGRRSLTLAVRSPAEAVQALCANFPGLRQRMSEPAAQFAVFDGKENIGEEGLSWQGSRPIRFVPVVAGAGGGVFQIIAGVVLIAVGVVLDFVSEGGTSSVTPYLYAAGISLIVGGIVQLLVPQPKTKSNDNQNQTGFSFSGPQNVTAQGAPVPLLLGGPAIVGSVVVSAGISVVGIPVGQNIDTTAPSVSYGP